MSKKNNMPVLVMSRRFKALGVILCFLLIAVIACLDRSWTVNRPRATSASSNKILADYEKYNGRTFLVTKVVDGDTIDISVPDGNYAHTRIRLWGVDTPETKNPRTPIMYFGPEASKFTTDEVLDKNVKIFLEKRQTRDRYRRLLAYVQLPDGQYLNEELLSQGFAYNDTRFKHSYYEHYKQLESAARRKGEGLWKNVTIDQMPEWRQRYELKDLN